MHLLQLTLENKILTAREILVNYCILILNSYDLSYLRRICYNIKPCHRCRARRLLQQGCEYLDGCALPGPVRTEKPEKLSLVDTERDSFDRLGPVPISLAGREHV